MRRGIDALDREIVALIGERSRYVEAAAMFKTDETSVRAPERRRWAEEEGLSPDVIEDLFRRLVSYFVDREMEDWKDGD